MNEGACAWCGASLQGMRSNAAYCTKQHKKNASSMRHRQRNPGYYRKYHGSPARVAWLEQNREQVRAGARVQQRRYRSEHPDAARAWWASNTERHRLYQANRRAAKVNNPGSVGVSHHDWQMLVNRYCGRCAYCDARPAALHMDHVIPLVRGGRHAIGNVLPACLSCNTSKGALFLTEWRRRRARFAA